MYACNKNVDLAIEHGRQRPPGNSLSQTKSTLISYAGQVKTSSSNSLRLSIFTPNVLMISKHDDGSLNQWAVSFAEDSAFSTVLSVSHKSRYCGHRFHLNDLACHSVLPLLLTTSHHNALRTPEADNILAPPEAYSTGVSFSRSLPHGSRPNRASLGGVSQDPNAIYSELILWRVDPVGPLSLSGGVSELARINSLHASAFANVAWLPTLIPSGCLGEDSYFLFFSLATPFLSLTTFLDSLMEKYTFVFALCYWPKSITFGYEINTDEFKSFYSALSVLVYK